VIALPRTGPRTGRLSFARGSRLVLEPVLVPPTLNHTDVSMIPHLRRAAYRRLRSKPRVFLQNERSVTLVPAYHSLTQRPAPLFCGTQTADFGPPL